MSPEGKVCTECLVTKPFTEFHVARNTKTGYHTKCKICRRAKSLEWHRNNPSRPKTPYAPDKGQVYGRQYRYKLSDAEFNQMLLDQDNRCGICREEFASTAHVDHDHSCCPEVPTCGRCTRMLLCNNCNRGLGYFKDSPEILRLAAKYLEGVEARAQRKLQAEG